MKRITIHPLCYLLIIPLLSIVYTVMNQQPQVIRSLYTDLDHAIPFIGIFIIPYMIWMPFMYGTLIYFYKQDRQLYFKTLLAYTIGVLICYGIYWAFQTYVPRPEVVGNDMISRFVQFVYRHDQPYNCFPSIHCFSSYLLYYAARKSMVIDRKIKLGIGVIVTFIILSTVFVKQHVVLDLMAGVMLAHLVFAIVHKYRSTGKRLALPTTSPSQHVMAKNMGHLQRPIKVAKEQLHQYKIIARRHMRSPIPLARQQQRIER